MTFYHKAFLVGVACHGVGLVILLLHNRSWLETVAGALCFLLGWFLSVVSSVMVGKIGGRLEVREEANARVAQTSKYWQDVIKQHYTPIDTGSKD